MDVAEAKYRANNSRRYILKPEVTKAWYMATLIVPSIAEAPNLVPRPIIKDQLPIISEAAAM